jgi:glycine cleavage system H lipoate-binding protein
LFSPVAGTVVAQRALAAIETNQQPAHDTWMIRVKMANMPSWTADGFDRYEALIK